MGTTIDTSQLSNTLTDLFKRREAEKAVHIRADRALKFAEVMKVIEAVKEAGASPVRMAIEGEPEKANGLQPDPMMLVVTIGDAGFDPTKVITGGIKLYLTEFALKYSEKDTIPKDFVVAEILEGGGCVIDGKPISMAVLKDELQTRLMRREDKRLVLLMKNDSAISYSSLADNACAAYEADADMLQLLTVTH